MRRRAASARSGVTCPVATDLRDLRRIADGEIGKIDKSTNEVGSACIVVDTGPWIFGKKVLLPAGMVRDVDPDTQTVFVDRTKDAIKDSPEYDESKFEDPAYRDGLGSYYGTDR
jgi:hypothetical protein